MVADYSGFDFAVLRCQALGVFLPIVSGLSPWLYEIL